MSIITAHSITNGQPILMRLPSFSVMTEPNFTLGALGGATFCSAVSAAYHEVVHWKRNLFSVPHGKAGTAFVVELSKLYRSYGEGSAMESIVLSAAVFMPAPLLQKPHARSKPKEHLKCSERHLLDWKEGNIETLLHEGHTIQRKFTVQATSTGLMIKNS